MQHPHTKSTYKLGLRSRIEPDSSTPTTMISISSGLAHYQYTIFPERFTQCPMLYHLALYQPLSIHKDKIHAHTHTYTHTHTHTHSLAHSLTIHLLWL